MAARLPIRLELVRSARDLAQLGPRFWFQGLVRLRGEGLMRVDLGNAGRAYIRRGGSDFETLRQVFRNRDYEIVTASVRAQIKARYDGLLAAGRTPVVIDAGANIGAASLWFAALYPQAAIVAVEPDPGNAEMLRRNLARIPHTTILQAAIGGEAGKVDLVAHDFAWGTQTRRGDGDCAIVTIADALASVPGGALFIVKIDIEGFEDDLFAANTDWLDDVHVVFVEPHDWMFPDRATSRGFQRAFAKRDFHLFVKGENLIYVRRIPGGR